MESYQREQPLADILANLYRVIEERHDLRPAGSYTTYLFDKGLDKILKKVGEEAAETIIAAKNPDPDALRSELCDLLYHLLVLMVERKITLEELAAELEKREGRPAETKYSKQQQIV